MSGYAFSAGHPCPKQCGGRVERFKLCRGKIIKDNKDQYYQTCSNYEPARKPEAQKKPGTRCSYFAWVGQKGQHVEVNNEKAMRHLLGTESEPAPELVLVPEPEPEHVNRDNAKLLCITRLGCSGTAMANKLCVITACRACCLKSPNAPCRAHRKKAQGSTQTQTQSLASQEGQTIGEGGAPQGLLHGGFSEGLLAQPTQGNAPAHTYSRQMVPAFRERLAVLQAERDHTHIQLEANKRSQIQERYNVLVTIYHTKGTEPCDAEISLDGSIYFDVMKHPLVADLVPQGTLRNGYSAYTSSTRRWKAHNASLKVQEKDIVVIRPLNWSDSDVDMDYWPTGLPHPSRSPRKTQVAEFPADESYLNVGLTSTPPLFSRTPSFTASPFPVDDVFTSRRSEVTVMTPTSLKRSRRSATPPDLHSSPTKRAARAFLSEDPPSPTFSSRLQPRSPTAASSVISLSDTDEENTAVTPRARNPFQIPPHYEVEIEKPKSALTVDGRSSLTPISRASSSDIEVIEHHKPYSSFPLEFAADMHSAFTQCHKEIRSNGLNQKEEYYKFFGRSREFPRSSFSQHYKYWKTVRDTPRFLKIVSQAPESKALWREVGQLLR